MYGGKLQKLQFDFAGPSIEAVLDRLPTASVVGEHDGVIQLVQRCSGQG